MAPDTLLTAEEVAKLLRLRVPTVYAAAAAGRLPSVRLWSGRRRSLIRFRREDIEEFIKHRTIAVQPKLGEKP